MADPSAAEVVKQSLACLATGAAAGPVALHTADSVIDMPGTPALPWAGRWVGVDKSREYVQVTPLVPETQAHVEALWVVDGDRVAVIGTEAAASRSSARAYQSRWCWVFAARAGKIALWDANEDTGAMFNCGPWR